jgi:hypothetical protein
MMARTARAKAGFSTASIASIDAMIASSYSGRAQRAPADAEFNSLSRSPAPWSRTVRLS